MAGALGITVAALAGPVRAEPPATPPGPSLEQALAPSSVPVGQQVYLDLRLNGEQRGESLVLLAPDGAWLPIDTLHGIGLRTFDGLRTRAAGKEWVSLRSLAPDLTFAIDERNLRIDLTAGPRLLPSERIDIGPARPAGTLMGDATSGYLNYAAQVNLAGQASGFGELGVSSGPALASTAFSVGPTGTPVRGISALTYQLASRLETVLAGDAVLSANAIGSSGVVGGITWARNFRLDPYLSVAPRPAFTAFAATPSTVEVWVNGMLTRQLTVPAGTVNLANIPAISGASDVRTVMRDSFGREQVFDLRANLAPQLLAPGLSDFSYTLGFVRQDLEFQSFAYGRPVAIGWHRIGLDDWVTLGGMVESTLDRFVLGPMLTLGTVVGQFDGMAVGSVAQGLPGYSASFGWSLPTRWWGASLRLRTQSYSFATAILDPWMDRTVADLSANFSVMAAANLTVGVDVGAARWRDTGESASATLRATYGILPGLTAMASVTQSIGGPTPGPSAMLSFTWAVDALTTAQASAGGTGTGATGSAGVARPLPQGPGYGYRVQGDMTTGIAQGSGLFQYQTGFGRYEADVSQVNSFTSGAVRAAGSLVVAGDRVFVARPVEEAFALVRVGVPGVTAYLENQPVGVTDAEGDLLIPNLLARYSNRLSIRAADIPMDYDVGKVAQLAAPFRKGCVVVRFDVTPIRAVVGTLRTGEGPGEVVARGEVVVQQDGVEVRTPTASDGRFFLERMQPGRHPLEAVWGGGRCTGTLEVAEKTGIQDVGALTCSGAEQLAGRLVSAR